jgi:hypothetical protein
MAYTHFLALAYSYSNSVNYELHKRGTERLSLDASIIPREPPYVLTSFYPLLAAQPFIKGTELKRSDKKVL